MIISPAHARRLIRQGKARKEGRVYHDDKTWWIITRLDLQRTDHALIGDGDLRSQTTKSHR